MPCFRLPCAAISARHASIASLLVALSLIALSGSSQTPTKTKDQTKPDGKSKPAEIDKQDETIRPSNPLRDSLPDKRTPLLQTPDRLKDYTLRENPNLQRTLRTRTEDLDVFGYNFFEPARRAIEAHRSRLFSIDANTPNSRSFRDGDSSGKSRAEIARANRPLTQEERQAAEVLTDEEKRDLLLRQRENRLTDDEKIRYRALLNPPKTEEEQRDPQPQPEEASKLLTDKEKQNPPRKQPGDPPTDAASKIDKRSPLGAHRNTGENPSRLEGANAYSEFVDPFAQFFSNPSFSVPLTYQLGGGDRVTLRVSSPLMDLRETTLVVDAQGALNVPDIGRLVVAGKTLSQAESEISTLMQRQYKNAKVSLSLKELRTMPITISGEAYAPGTYQVPSVATAFNLLYATGGPTIEGSMRRIQILRRGKPVENRTLDLYKFLLIGDRTSDITLEAGDTIYIPARDALVAFVGEVRRPAFYELLETETLKEGLVFAGGIKPSGVAQRVQVSTLQPGTGRLLKDVDVTSMNNRPAVPLFDGDVVEIFSVRSTLTNVVTIEGAVDQPGQYAITPNMTVADLVERARGMLTEAYPTLAQLYRWNPDNTLTLIEVNLEKALTRDRVANLPLSRWDRLTVLTRQDIAWTGRREVTIRGAVKNPGIYYRSENMKVRDLLITAGGTLPEAYQDEAYLLHQKPDKSFSYEYVSLTAAMRGDAQNNVLIQDRDTLAVYRTDEARFTPEHSIEIVGEVVTPGRYPRGENMKLSDALKVTGGLTPQAGDRILVAHARQEQGKEPLSITVSPTDGKPAQDIALQDGDVISIQGRGTFQEAPYIVYVKGAVNRPGPVILRGPKVHLSEVIKEAGGLKPEGYAEGLEFYRNPTLMATNKQNQIADIINDLNKMLNQSDFKRKSALAVVEELKAIGNVAKSSAGLPIPGLTGTPDTSANPALASGANNLFNKELVTPARLLTPEDLQPRGNVAVNLAEAIRKPNSEDDIVMVDGDTLTVPVRPTTVQVVGAVMQSRGVLFREGEKLDYYLDQAGGYAPDAAKERILIIRVGGGLTPIKKVKSFMPGDLIFVPTEVLAVQINKRSNDFDNIFRSLTSSALIFFVAKKLVGF